MVDFNFFMLCDQMSLKLPILVNFSIDDCYRHDLTCFRYDGLTILLIFNFRGKKMSGRIIKQNVINSAHLVAHSSIRLFLLVIHVIRSIFLKLQVTKASNTPLGACGRGTLIL